MSQRQIKSKCVKCNRDIISRLDITTGKIIDKHCEVCKLRLMKREAYLELMNKIFNELSYWDLLKLRKNFKNLSEESILKIARGEV